MVAVYRPDNWVMLKMTWKEDTVYKVLGGWAGSYLHGTSWRLSSMVKEVKIDNGLYYFEMDSGSTYICHPDDYGHRMSTIGIYNTMVEQHKDYVTLLEDCDWTKFNFGDANVLLG